MTAAGAACLLAATGFHFSVPDARSVGAEARRAYHVFLITGCTFALVVVASAVPRVSPWILGSWFALLTAVYSGHSMAARHWGSPMSRDVFAYGIRSLGRLSRLRPGSAATALILIGLAFAIGWAAARVDMSLVPGPLRVVAGALGWLACREGARRARIRGRIEPSIDILVGVLRQGHGPQGPPPPEDPSLGPRGFAPGTFVPSRRPNVIVFVVDSARADRMSINGCERRTTPFLDSLVERGARAVPLCLAVGSTSEAGLWAILSSRRVRHQATNAPCLHDVLRSAGYSLRFLCAGIHRNSMGLDQLYGERLDQFEDQLIDESLLAHVRELPGSRRDAPSFVLLHLMSAHSMSGKDPDAVWRPAQDRLTAPRGRSWDRESRQPFINHYDNTMLQADDYLRRMTEYLQQKGYLDDAVVIVTADHGEHVLDRDSLVGHGRSLYQEAVHIPLLVWDTTRDPGPACPLADQTDIAPTVLDMMGLASPPAFQGRSIFRVDARASSHLEHVLHRVGQASIHMEAVILRTPEGTFKILRHRQGGRVVLDRVFCLTTDPLEQTDLAADLGEETRVALREALQGYWDVPALALSTTWRHLELRAAPAEVA